MKRVHFLTFFICLSVFLIFTSVKARPEDVSMLPVSYDFSFTTDVLGSTGLGFLEGTADTLYGEGFVNPEFLAAVVLAARNYPPCTEAALVDLFGLRAKGGDLSSPFYMSSYNNRSWGYTSSTKSGNLTNGEKVARVYKYETMSHIYTSPLVLDMKGDGTPDVSGGEVAPHIFSFDDTYTAFIDLKNTGYKVLTEWVGPGAGLLVSPVSTKSIEEKDGQLIWNGPITGADLIGTVTGYRNGFEHLAVFDTDKDGKVAKDELNRIYVWVNQNFDPHPDPWELFSPEDLGIQELRLEHTGVEGSYVDSSGIKKMWDWWPSYLEIRPEPPETQEFPPKAPYGITEYIGGADLVTNLSLECSKGQRIIPIELLEKFGFNANESQLAKLDNKARTMLLTDYRLDSPHTARIWLIQFNTPCSANLSRYSLPEDSVDNVAFSGIRDQLLVLSRNQTRLYVLEGWKSGEGKVVRISFNDTMGFRVAWGTAFAHGRYTYLPGYFYDKDGVPFCDTLVRLTLKSNKAILRPVADVHWLLGHRLQDLGMEEPFAFWLESPKISYVSVRDLKEGVNLLSLRSKDEPSANSGGGGWCGKCSPQYGDVLEIDHAMGIASLSAYGNCVEYLAQRQDDVWEVRWCELSEDASGSAQRLKLPLSYRPAYAELADYGKQLIWAHFDWTGSKTQIWTMRALESGAEPHILLELDSIPGSIRVAPMAPVCAVQTRDGVIVLNTR